MTTDNLTEEQRIERRRAFYAKVAEGLWKTMQSYPLQADLPKSHPDDYDGGRYDFYTTRGVK
jgi:hypothetical protein